MSAILFELTMSVGLFLISLFLVLRLRKIQLTLHGPSKWTQSLSWVSYAVIGLMLVELLVEQGRAIPWLWYGFLLLLLGLVYGRQEFAPARPAIWAVLPLVLVSLLGDFLALLQPDLYVAWKMNLEMAQGFAVVWLIGMAVLLNRQHKALEKERVARRQEEEQQRALTQRKAELEEEVAERTRQLTRQKEELQQALAELKATQTQLVQLEKLASLGELTAGIAHEIQNPLNFVNNFSEVSGELLVELQEEMQNGQPLPVLVSDLLTDLAQNLQKIQQHGRRADGIVKNMLQHSRSNAGEKQPTDLNALADEYLHLAYHGLRARDNSFNSTLTTHLDPSLPKVAVIPQDLGRVLLNLFNNAFYATREKQKTAGPDFRPEVKVSTCHKNGMVEVRVRDNGNGIPQPVREKMFQPFYTTKPAGQGTGLGLSLTYDIITKGHSGEVEVDTREGEYAEFLVRLPVYE